MTADSVAMGNKDR